MFLIIYDLKVHFSHLVSMVKAEDLVWMSGCASRAARRKKILDFSNTGMQLYFKKDFMQVTGSFKERGARYFCEKLSESEKSLGVVTAIEIRAEEA